MTENNEALNEEKEITTKNSTAIIAATAFE